ncbi:hypothetical protein JCM13304A_14180 [Desulfothermus okinawensis JCM 13304]
MVKCIGGKLCYLLRPYYKNLNKRLIKSPKLYFLDTGLLCYLVGIKNIDQVKFHPLFGSIFESFVVSELLKVYYNHVLEPNLFFYRDYRGNEIDIIIDNITSISQIEIKSAKTIAMHFLKGFEILKNQEIPIKDSFLIYGGHENLKVKSYKIISWKNIEESLCPELLK